MRVRNASATLGLLALAAAGISIMKAQGNQPPPGSTPAAQPGVAPGVAPKASGRKPGGFVPGQKRPPGDPAVIARGQTLYGIHCTGCHGSDLRGGDLGGPNLLRSQVALSDLNGENILPIIHGSRKEMGMPAIDVNDQDGLAIATYIRSIVETIGIQGMPPSVGIPAVNVLVGNAKEGQAYFAAKCSSCHSATGDLKGIATRITEPRALQNAWVSGEFHERGGRPAEGKPVTVSVTLPGGQKVDGKLVHIDDFLVSLTLDDGRVRSFRRAGDTPKVEVNDPMKGHRDLLPTYTDRAMHDVTAYLATLK